MKPAYLSVSQLTQYLLCPAKYRFHYVEQVAPAFRSAALVLGSAVHSTLDALHRAWKDGRSLSAEEVERTFNADLASAFHGDSPVHGDKAGLKESGLALLSCYLAETPPKEVKAVELPFEVPLSDPRTGEALPAPLQGYIDLIEGDGTLVEIKTAARRPDKAAVELHLQLSAYSYAMIRIYRERPKARLDVLLKTKTPRFDRIEVRRDERDDRRFLTVATEVLHAIDQEAFFPNPGWVCAECEFRKVCPVWKG